MVVTNGFQLKWNDRGSGGIHNGAFYRPNAPSGFWPIGDYGQSHYGTPSGPIIVLKALVPGALAHPAYYIKIWADHGSGSKRDGSFWLPVPHSGYVCMSVVAQSGYGTPSTNEIMCVRSDLTGKGSIGGFVWDDSRTGAKNDFGSWLIAGNDNCLTTGAFVGVTSHDRNAAVAHRSDLTKCLNLATLKTPAPPTLQELDAIIQKFGPKVHFHSEEKYVMASVEWFLKRAQLITKVSGSKTQATMVNLPQGAENGTKFQLVLTGRSTSLLSRLGDLSTAKAYVHAKSLPFSTDLQFWFFYAYNGPGTARFKSLAFDTTVHAGNPSMAPLGEHEGDWEHVTIRIGNSNRQIEKVYFSQHSGGVWVLPQHLERDGNKIIVYSSKNGHASYPNPGGHYTEHRKYAKAYTLGFGLEFWLRNDCNKGRSIDCSEKYELVSADNFGTWKTAEPKWLYFYGRWGKSTSQVTLSRHSIQGIIEAVAGPIMGSALSSLMVTDIATHIAATYQKEDQDGPVAPIGKDCWNGSE